SRARPAPGDGCTGNPADRPDTRPSSRRLTRWTDERVMPPTKRLAEPAWDALFEALAVFYWRKRGLEAFLRAQLGDYPELLAPLDFAGYKRTVAADLVASLRRDEGRYQGTVIDLLVELAKFDERFPRLAREEDGERLVAAARQALADVRTVTELYS